MIEMLLDNKYSKIIRAHARNGKATAKQAIFEYLIVVEPELNKSRCEPIAAGLWSDLGIREKFVANRGLWPKEQ